jgi:hypothetical protein
MRFMVQVRATEETEAGVMPSMELLEAMGRFNTEMVEAGIMKAGEGLLPTSRDAARISFDGGKAQVTDGPFADVREIVSGFWIIEEGSKAEAVDWMRRAPMNKGAVLEIRRIASAEDFGEAFTPELQAQEEELRARTA